MDDDSRLLTRARRGDEAAFSGLFARYHRAIYRYAAYMCGADAADDIVQETFLAVLRQAGRPDLLRGTLTAYLFGIARHKVLNRLSSSGAPFLVPLDDFVSGDLVEEQMNGRTAIDDLARTETIEVVRAAVYSLGPAYREVIVLCEFQELDLATAAGVIGCPIGSVKSRLHRARKLLTTKLSAMRLAL